MRDYTYLLSFRLTPPETRPKETIKLGVKIYKEVLCLKSMVFMTINIRATTSVRALTRLSQTGTEERFTHSLRVRN